MKMIAYAVGIQPVDDKYYAFIPDFMKSFFANSIGELMTSARETIKKCIIDLNSDDEENYHAPHPLSADEALKRIEEITGNVYKEITYVDIDLECIFPESVISVSVNTPEWMIHEAKNLHIDTSSIFTTALEKEIHLRRMYDKVMYHMGTDVMVSLDRGTIYGRIIGTIPDTPMANEYFLKLDTGKQSTMRINLLDIRDISKARLIYDELGTFHFEVMEGQADFAGRIYWDNHEIDVYLDISYGLPPTTMPSMIAFHKVHSNKKRLDSIFKSVICQAFKDKTGKIKLPGDSDATESMMVTVDEQQFKRSLELYFINISNTGGLYLDYNFEFETKTYTFGISGDTDGNVEKMSLRFSDILPNERIN